MSTPKLLHLKLELYAVVSENDLRYYLENTSDALEALLCNEAAASFQVEETSDTTLEGLTELNGIPVQNWLVSSESTDDDAESPPGSAPV